MLFHPRKKVNLFFFSLQGIFPKRKAALAEKLSVAVSENLLSKNEIKQKILESTGSNEFLIKEIESHLDAFLKKKITEKFPMLSMFINDDMINRIKEMLLEELVRILPSLRDKMMENAFAKIDTKKMIEDKVMNFSLNELEDLLFSLLKKEFRFIEISGGVLGFLIGMFQLLLISL